MKTLTLDIETTGLPPKAARYETDFMNFPYIITIAWKINDGETKYLIVNQEGIAIPPEATAINGITNEMCDASEITLSRALADLLFDAQDVDVVIGHNIYFDTSIIKACLLRLLAAGKIVQAFYDQFVIMLGKEKRVDTMYKTISFCARGGKFPKLTELHQKLFNESFDAHNSKDDVNATYRCYVRLKELGVI